MLSCSRRKTICSGCALQITQAPLCSDDPPGVFQVVLPLALGMNLCKLDVFLDIQETKALIYKKNCKCKYVKTGAE